MQWLQRRRSSRVPEKLIIDASAMVDYLVGSPLAHGVAERLRNVEISVPAHFDGEVLSALGRLHRGGDLSEPEVEERLALTAPLLEGAWALHHNVRIVDALYIELAAQLDATILTTDSGMATAATKAELIK
jgi:predicted nucleic acid-binding protein